MAEQYFRDLFVLSCLRQMAPVIFCNNLCLFFSLSVVLQLRQRYNNVKSGKQNSACPYWKLIYIQWNTCVFVLASRTERELHGNSLFNISCSSFCPPSLLALPIKVLMLFTLSFLWPPSSASALRLSSPSASNSSSFIETNRLEVTPGRADDDSWLLRSTQSEGFSLASKTRWYSFVAMAPNFFKA